MNVFRQLLDEDKRIQSIELRVVGGLSQYTVSYSEKDASLMSHVTEALIGSDHDTTTVRLDGGGVYNDIEIGTCVHHVVVGVEA